MSLLLAQRYSPDILNNLAIGVSQLLRILTAGLFFWSADLYRQTRYLQRIPWRWVAGIAAWFVLAPLLRDTCCHRRSRPEPGRCTAPCCSSAA